MAQVVVPVGKRLFTLGQLPDEVRRSGGPEVSVHQVKYAIDRYRIEPTTRVGIIRVWSEEAIPKITIALTQVAANRRNHL